MNYFRTAILLEIGTTTGLRKRASGIKEPRPMDLPFSQEARDAVVSPPCFSDRGEAIHKAAAYIIGRS